MSTNQKPPEVRCDENGAIIGWIEFERWAVRNIPEWQHVMRLSSHGQVTHRTAIEMAAYLMTCCRADLLERLKQIELLVPRKMRFPDGSIRIYRCPDELVPLEPETPNPFPPR